MEVKLNPNFQIKLNNFDDYRGNILQTLGIRLNKANGVDSRRGEIACGTKMFPHSTSNDSGLSSIGLIQSFIFSNADGGNKYWAADTSKLYKIGSPTVSRFAADGLSNTPTSVNGDLVIFGRPSGSDRLVCPTSTDLWMLTGGSWTANWWTSTLGQAALTSNVHTLLFFPNPFLLMIPDGNKVHTIDQALVVVNSRLQLPSTHTIEWSRYWNGRAYFGISTNDKTSGGVWEYDPVNEIAMFYPYYLNGGGAGTPYVRDTLNVVTSDGRIMRFSGSGFVLYLETVASKCNQPFNLHRNGIVVQGQEIFFLSGGASSFFPAGVYMLDLVDGNFYHRLPLVTGNSDAAQYLTSAVGALWTDGQFLFGGETLTGSAGIYMNFNAFAATVNSRNWLVTPKIPASSIKDIAQKIWAFYSLFSSESFDLKCRISELVSGFIVDNVTGTWTSTTVFTCTASAISAAVQGDEVTILKGTNSGLIAHISSIVVNGATATVTLDEAIGLGSGTSEMQMLNFQKMTSISNAALQAKDTSLPFAKQPYQWVQFKVVIRGTESVIKGVSLDKEGFMRIL